MQRGLLPPAYRTQLCAAVAEGWACPLGPICSYAHSQQELRVEAGIQVRVKGGGWDPGERQVRGCQGLGQAIPSLGGHRSELSGALGLLPEDIRGLTMSISQGWPCRCLRAGATDVRGRPCRPAHHSFPAIHSQPLSSPGILIMAVPPPSRLPPCPAAGRPPGLL